MQIALDEQKGTCRWCSCTDEHACDVGCYWVDARRQTLCSACVALDKLIRTASGRAELARLTRGPR